MTLCMDDKEGNEEKILRDLICLVGFCCMIESPTITKNHNLTRFSSEPNHALVPVPDE